MKLLVRIETVNTILLFIFYTYRSTILYVVSGPPKLRYGPAHLSSVPSYPLHKGVCVVVRSGGRGLPASSLPDAPPPCSPPGSTSQRSSIPTRRDAPACLARSPSRHSPVPWGLVAARLGDGRMGTAGLGSGVGYGRFGDGRPPYPVRPPIGTVTREAQGTKGAVRCSGGVSSWYCGFVLRCLLETWVPQMGRWRTRQGRLGETERGWDGSDICVVWVRGCGIEGMRRSTRVSKSWQPSDRTDRRFEKTGPKGYVGGPRNGLFVTCLVFFIIFT
jgi:hypothetical protein